MKHMVKAGHSIPLSSMTKKEAGFRIRSIRDWRRLSQDELAELLRTTQPKISQLECGVCGLSFDDMCRLADVLHFSIDAFRRTGPQGFDITACLLPVPQAAA